MFKKYVLGSYRAKNSTKFILYISTVIIDSQNSDSYRTKIIHTTSNIQQQTFDKIIHAQLAGSQMDGFAFFFAKNEGILYLQLVRVEDRENTEIYFLNTFQENYFSEDYPEFIHLGSEADTSMLYYWNGVKLYGFEDQVFCKNQYDLRTEDYICASCKNRLSGNTREKVCIHCKIGFIPNEEDIEACTNTKCDNYCRQCVNSLISGCISCNTIYRLENSTLGTPSQCKAISTVAVER